MITKFYDHINEKKSAEYSKFVTKMDKEYNKNDKKTFLDWWRLLFTVEESGYDRYDENIRIVSEFPGYPSGLDTENIEVCYLDDEKAVVYSGGDWQEGKYIVIKLGSKYSGDLSKLEVDEVLNKNPFKQSSRERQKFRKDNDLVNKSKFDKDLVLYTKKSANSESCNGCEWKTNYNEKCRKVDGDIDETGWCKLYKKKTQEDDDHKI